MRLSVVFSLRALVALAALMTPSAYAACSSPAGQAGDIAWASNYSVPVYCDGTNWNSMAGGSGGGSADNLSNHTATQALNMGGFDISNLGTATGTAAVLGGLTVTGNASITTISATNISGSLIQVGTGNSATCSSATKGAIRYSNTSSTIEYCNSTAWTSLGPSATTVPAFSVHKNGTAQTVPAATLVSLTWSTEAFDTNNNFASNRFTPTLAGKYLLSMNAQCSTANSACYVFIYKNGSAVATGRSVASGGNYSQAMATILLDMSGTSDYAEAFAVSTGTTIDGAAEATRCDVNIYKNTAQQVRRIGAASSSNAYPMATALLDMNGTTDYIEAVGYVVGDTTFDSTIVDTYMIGTLIAPYGSGGGGGATPGGTDTQVQFNDGGGALGGDADYTWNKTSNVLTITGTASATALNSVNASVTTLTARSVVDATGGTVSATKVIFADGDATSPALYFSNDGDTGLYRIGANSMGVAASGAEVARFTSTGISTSTLIGNIAVSTTYLSATTASTTLLQIGASSATCASSINGAIRFNTTSDTLQICTSSGWKSLTSGTVAAGASAIASLTDVSVSSPVSGMFIQYDGAKWAQVTASTMMSTTTMIPNWPDAIRCSGASGSMYLYHSFTSSAGVHAYDRPGSNDNRKEFTSAGAYSSGSDSGYSTSCTSQSMSQIVAAGNAFNFIGSYTRWNDIAGFTNLTANNVGIGVTVSSSAKFEVNGLVSATSAIVYGGATITGAVSASSISATNISGTLIQAGPSSASCAASINGALRYNTTSNTLQICTGTTWTSLSSSTSAGASAMSLLTDVSASSPVTNQILQYNGSKLEAVSTSTLNNNFTCPAGFALLQNNNQTLGCIQRVTNSSATCQNASLACFSTYGGRLPQLTELQIGATYGSGFVGGAVECANAISGSIRFNTTSNTLQICVGTGWVSLSSGTTGGGASALSALTDVSAASPSANQILQYNNSISKWEATGISQAMSTTTMLVGWPDAILCSVQSSTAKNILIGTLKPHTNGIYYYRTSQDVGLQLNASGAITVEETSYSDCNVGMTIAQLYAAGQAFNFIGSYTRWQDVNNFTYLTANNVGIGVTVSSSAKFEVNGLVSATSAIINGPLQVTSNTTAYAFLYPSDRRLKQDIAPIDASLEKLLQLNGVTFRYRKEGDQGAQHMGVIAQDVEKVFPEVVLTGADGMKSVNYPALVAPLIQAVKQLKADNEALRLRLKAANDNVAQEIEELKRAIGTTGRTMR